METINQPMTPCTCRAPYARRSFNASQTQLAAVSNSRSLDLEIVTEEGDKVTFSMDAKASALYAAYGRAEGDDGGFAAQWGELSAGQYEREVTFSVEGDLNARERKEVRKVLRTINNMMRKFVKGKIEPMMEKAGKLADLKTIDTLDLEMSYERHVLVAQQSQLAAAYDQHGAVNEAPPAVAPSTGIDNQPVDLETESRALTREMAREVASAQAPLANMLDAAHRLLEAYRDMAREWNPLGGKILDHVRDLFDAATAPAGQAEPFIIAESGEADD